MRVYITSLHKLLNQLNHFSFSVANSISQLRATSVS